MNQCELTSHKKRNATADDDKIGEENLTEIAAKKLKSETLNSNPAAYSPNTQDGSAEFDKPYYENRDKIGRHSEPTGGIYTVVYNTNRSDTLRNSFQQVSGKNTREEECVMHDEQNVNEANYSDSVPVTAGAAGIYGSRHTEASIRNFSELDNCDTQSSSNSNAKETVYKTTVSVILSTGNRQTIESNREHYDVSAITTIVKEVSNSSQDYTQRDADNSLIRSTTESIEDPVKDLLEEFSRLRISEPRNVDSGNSQFYVVAYSAVEDIQKCIITKKWSQENRRFIGKAWNIHSGPVYLFFTVYGTNQLCAVATLDPDKVHESYIGVNFLRAIDIPKARLDDESITTFKPKEIIPMDQDFGKTAVEIFMEYEAEKEDKSVVDDISESLIVRFRQNVGLRNLGNTCYINCILQCLAKVPWKLPAKHMNDELITEFFRVMSWLSEPGGVGDPISPQHLRAQIAKFSSRFASHQQQDAHELLLYLLGELNKKLKNILADDESKENCLQEQFSGKLQNSVVFECGHDVYNDQPFFTVSLSIPENCRVTGSASVSDCLESFLAEERMDGDNKAMCLECSGELKECTLRTQFQQLPSTLILHIQRTCFSQLDKLDTEISIPLKALEMKDLSGEMCEYNLFAVCNHYGSLKCGHYTADVKCHRSNTWFTYSDSSVYQMNAMSEQDQVEFRSKSASILFYAKN